MKDSNHKKNVTSDDISLTVIGCLHAGHHRAVTQNIRSGCIDGWMTAWIYRYIHRSMDEWRKGWTDRWMHA